MTATQANLCPDCNRQLFFSGNGRSLICERCGYSQPTQREKPSIKALEYAQSLRMQYDHLDDEDGRSSARIRVAEGKELVRMGKLDDAYDALTWVLKSQSSDMERANAWYWLSHVFEEPADKRACLEHALSLHPNLGLARRDLAVIDGRLSQDDIINPDTVHENRQIGVETAVVQKHACPRCDAGMQFNAETQLYSCGFCGMTQTIDQQAQTDQTIRVGQGKFEQDFLSALSTAKGHLQPINTRAFTCKSCATDFMLAPETLSLTCPYCESVFVTETAVSKELMPPHAILPFAITIDQAERQMKQWFKQNKLAPNHVAPLYGVYHPLWTFDIGGEVKWNGKIERNDNWVPVSGNKLIFFDDVLVPGCRHVTKPLLQNFKAFNLEMLEAYDQRFLAQWPAELYTFPLADASINGRKRILKQLRKNTRTLTNRSEYIRDLRISTNKVIIESFKLLLLPVWIGHYRLDDKTFELTINGQTGDVLAERPLSLLGKVASWFQR